MKKIIWIILFNFLLFGSFAMDEMKEKLPKIYYHLIYDENKLSSVELLYLNEGGRYFYKWCSLSDNKVCDTASGKWEMISNTEMRLISNNFLSLSDDIKRLTRAIFHKNILLTYEGIMYYYSENKLSFSKEPDNKDYWYPTDAYDIPREIKKILKVKKNK